MNLNDDYLLEHVSQERANYQMAMYAVYLSQGETLFFKSIKVSTIATYLRNAATLIKRVRGSNPRYQDPSDKSLAPIIRAVLDPLKKWEELPNRREPFTLDMLQQSVNQTHNSHPNSILSAISDNFVVALHAGMRCAEWAQTATNRSKIGSHHLNFKGLSYALTLADIEFHTEPHNPYSIENIIAKPDFIPHSCTIRFKTQKNGTNNEFRKFPDNKEKPDLCFVRAMASIVRRFVSIMGYNEELPISIYQPDPLTSKEARNITRTEIEFHMQRIAAKTLWS